MDVYGQHEGQIPRQSNKRAGWIHAHQSVLQLRTCSVANLFCQGNFRSQKWLEGLVALTFQKSKGCTVDSVLVSIFHLDLLPLNQNRGNVSDYAGLGLGWGQSAAETVSVAVEGSEGRACGLVGLGQCVQVLSTRWTSVTGRWRRKRSGV
jgi:hypothetical protein